MVETEFNYGPRILHASPTPRVLIRNSQGFPMICFVMLPKQNILTSAVPICYIKGELVPREVEEAIFVSETRGE
jgi:hypothetical protein